MRIRSNLHTHTIYCDGQNTPLEMVEKALELGFRSIGFSGHAYTAFDGCCCMTPTGTLAYRREIRELQQQYAGRIDIFLGLENDGLVPYPADGFDYIIGSLHYLYVDDRYHTLDNSHEQMRACIDESFGGDALKMIQAYYDLLVSYVTTDNVDIVGHFDVFQKRNADNRYFDAQSPAYRRIALDAIEAIANAGKIIEVNTGAIARGFIKDPYPAPFLLRRLLELKAPVILSSDAHVADKLDGQFDEISAMLYDMGFRETMELKRGQGFVPVRLEL